MDVQGGVGWGGSIVVMDVVVMANASEMGCSVSRVLVLVE